MEGTKAFPIFEAADATIMPAEGTFPLLIDHLAPSMQVHKKFLVQVYAFRGSWT